jgi:RNA polymerase sigma factor for flagellar operon FliA
MATALVSWLNSNSSEDWAAACNNLNVEQIEPMPTPSRHEGLTPGKKGMERAIRAKAVPTPITTAVTNPATSPVTTLATTADSTAVNENVASVQADKKMSRRDRVVLEHLPLVKAIAVRVYENLPVHVDLDDLVHAGILGLFDAATKFDPEKQVVFSSYAKHRIKGAILDSLRQLDWASRDLRRRHKQLEAATRDLAAELQRTPTEAEIAQKLGVDVDRWRQMMIDLRSVGLVSASTRANENDDLPAPDFPSKPETQPDSMCAREQLRAVLATAMKTLPERYKKVVVLYYTNEMTMKEIGGVLGINESRVSQIHKSALEKMNVVLQGAGIHNCAAF